jgi:hypothetical protein
MFFFFIVWKCSHLKSRKTPLLMVFHWRLQVPSIAVVENMCYFEGDGKRYYPFGQGSGAQVCYIKCIGFTNFFKEMTTVLWIEDDFPSWAWNVLNSLGHIWYDQVTDNIFHMKAGYTTIWNPQSIWASHPTRSKACFWSFEQHTD